MVECNGIKVPMAKNTRLTTDMNGQKVDGTTYKKMVGKLIYVVNSRPNIKFSMSTISQFLVYPQLPHVNLVKQIFLYLKNIINYGILYKKEGNIHSEAFMDVDWASKLELKRSTNGYILKIKNSLVASKNGNIQVIVALFSVEAEYYALLEGTKEVV